MNVGNAWIFINEEEKAAFLYDIIVDENARGKGLGKQAMLAIKEECKKYDARQLWPNVFGHNQDALRFNQSLGLEVAAVTMKWRT